MAHRVLFKNFDSLSELISEQEVIDLIDLFFRSKNSCFAIIGDDTNKGVRGSHSYDSFRALHLIKLSKKNIEQAFSAGIRVGGNMKAPTLKMAALMVLAHELQHANQTMSHSRGEIFYMTKKYEKRPCERDARMFVDSNMDVLAAIAGCEIPTQKCIGDGDIGTLGDALLEVAEVIGDTNEATIKELISELRAAGINNSKNVERLMDILISRGVNIKYV